MISPNREIIPVMTPNSHCLHDNHTMYTQYIAGVNQHLSYGVNQHLGYIYTKTKGENGTTLSAYTRLRKNESEINYLCILFVFFFIMHLCDIPLPLAMLCSHTFIQLYFKMLVLQYNGILFSTAFQCVYTKTLEFSIYKSVFFSYRVHRHRVNAGWKWKETIPFQSLSFQCKRSLVVLYNNRMIVAGSTCIIVYHNL